MASNVRDFPPVKEAREYEQELAERDRQHRQALDELTAKHGKDLADQQLTLDRKHQEEIAELRSKHEQQIADLSRPWADQLTELNDNHKLQLAQNSLDTEREKNDADRRVKAEQSKRRAVLASLRHVEEHCHLRGKEVEALEIKLERTSAEREALRVNLEGTVGVLKTELEANRVLDARLHGQRKEIDTLESGLERTSAEREALRVNLEGTVNALRQETQDLQRTRVSPAWKYAILLQLIVVALVAFVYFR